MTTPYPPQQPQYPQYPQQPQNGQSAIAVTTKYMWIAFLMAFIKPKILLNGHQVGGVWGRNVIPVPPGQHQLHLHVPYFLPPRIGPADLTVPVQPGQTVELEYRAPVWGFSPGSLGTPPQQYNGMGFQIGILVAVVAIICVCCVINIVAANA